MEHSCRFCGSALRVTFCDLGSAPLSNAFLTPERLDAPETRYPLHVRVCEKCLLAQLPELQAPERIFSDYAYFSSYSASWLEHARRYAEIAERRFRLGPSSRVIEIASNDGYLLQYFRQRAIPVLGIEPARNVAAVAQSAGIETRVAFFGTALARELKSAGAQADLLIGNNVLAHVPDLNDFVQGLKLALKPDGTLTLEFPHLLRLIEGTQFDTIYHEHFSYFSLMAASRILRAHGLVVFDVEELPTHGGSLRIFAGHAESAAAEVGASVAALIGREQAFGLERMETYRSFGASVAQAKRSLLRFLIDARDSGKSVACYGAPAKANTLLNYCGVSTDLIDYTVDRSPHKQGLYLPGSRIPVFAPSKIFETRPDYLLILPWNLREEIVQQVASVRGWGCRFVVPIPRVAEFA